MTSSCSASCVTERSTRRGRSPDLGSGDSAPSERPKRYDDQGERDDDQRDPDEIGVNPRHIPEAHVDVLFVPRVARVQDQEQPDQPDKRSEEQAQEATQHLHDVECTSGGPSSFELRAR